ncbi:hypothetical protein NDU88_005160 [Pleurodeles waltl]|uniref:C2 domain-containing protein n=1 Tax=Pleurodeles waltl TaxID=8319 RepID=A0AAV7QEI4_PLEWA|nr:hypothetical protein NDU88_005160 [Pleurodeles waltl]
MDRERHYSREASLHPVGAACCPNWARGAGSRLRSRGRSATRPRPRVGGAYPEGPGEPSRGGTRAQTNHRSARGIRGLGTRVSTLGRGLGPADRDQRSGAGIVAPATRGTPAGGENKDPGAARAAGLERLKEGRNEPPIGRAILPTRQKRAQDKERARALDEKTEVRGRPTGGDPYVKVSLLCDGRRLKKKKTTIKKNTLNPTYNEAIIFDIPPENMDQVSLLISVMDYDRVGHNEIIGVCRAGNNAEGLGRDHWNEMLAYPRKPIAHWHSLVEVKRSFKEWHGRAASFDSQGSCPSPKPPPTP